jgi:hypothetical protein
MSIPILPKRKIGGTEVTAIGYGAMPYDQTTSADVQTKVNRFVLVIACGEATID